MKRSNTYQLAVGLKYEEGETDAPEVVMKADASVADRAVKIARRYGVAVVEDTQLARALEGLPLDTEIPAELYRATAIVINSIEQRKR